MKNRNISLFFKKIKKILFVSIKFHSFIIFKLFLMCDNNESYLDRKQEEYGLYIIKPQGLDRGLVGKMITKFEDKGYRLIDLKMLTANDELITKHYKDVKREEFFEALKNYMLEGPIIVMLFSGHNINKNAKKMIGKTNVTKFNAGTIRGDFGIDSCRNIIHGSDSKEAAEREVKLWFPDYMV